jgi:hypothetical protein
VVKECITLEEFKRKVHTAAGCAYFSQGSNVETAIHARANLWTEDREAKPTSLIQSVDEAPSIALSDRRWEAGLANPMFRDVNPEIINEHMKLIRTLCAEESTLEGISQRCWLQFQKTEDEEEAKMIVDEHLERYGDVKDAVLDRLVVGALTNLNPDLDLAYKKAIGRHMPAILGAMGHGFTRHKCRVYEAWWKDLKLGQGLTEEGWVKSEVKWCAIDMKVENLAMFVRNHSRDEQDSQVPILLYRARMEVPMSKEIVMQIVSEYLARGETAVEYVRLWWNLMIRKAVDFDWLLEEIQSDTWEAQDLRKALARSAGRNRPKILEAVTDKFQMGELGDMFAIFLRLGFVFTTEIK